MSAYDRLYSLLRLACKTGNGYVPERQNALERAIAHAQKHSIDLQKTIYELRVDLDGLQHSFSRSSSQATATPFHRTPRPHSEQPDPQGEFDGVYPVAGFQYYEGPRLRSLFQVGQRVSLQALTTNPYDQFAVAIFYGDLMIGYVPRRKNQRIWTWLRNGGRTTSYISSIHSFDGYGAIEVTIRKNC